MRGTDSNRIWEKIPIKTKDRFERFKSKYGRDVVRFKRKKKMTKELAAKLRRTIKTAEGSLDLRDPSIRILSEIARCLIGQTLAYGESTDRAVAVSDDVLNLIIDTYNTTKSN